MEGFSPFKPCLNLTAIDVMLNRFFKSFTFYLLLLGAFLSFSSLFSISVYAQQCAAPYETITRLYEPEPGAFMVWESLYNEYERVQEGREGKFVSVLGKNDGHILVAGEASITKNVRPSLLLVEFDSKGRAVWEKMHKVPYLDGVVKIIPNGTGSLVLANQSQPGKLKSIWLGFFDENGRKISSQIIKDRAFGLSSNDIHPSVNGKGWVMPVSAVKKLSEKEGYLQRNASIYLLNSKGKKQDMRSYILGLKTELYSVKKAIFEGERVGYIATGYFENNSGKKIGWVMRLNPDLSIVWQKEFGRGISAKLVSSDMLDNGDVLVVGDVNSAESNNSGGWLAKLSGEYGEVLWQRYFASEGDAYNYRSQDVSVNPDGIISVLLSGKPIEGKLAEDKLNKRRSHGLLLTLSPRGVITSGDRFYSGADSYVSELTYDELGRRIMVGYSFIESYLDVKKQRQAFDTDSVPLQEEGEVHLPDVQLSEKTREGLALLSKKISSQEIIHHSEVDNGHSKSAKVEVPTINLVQKAWVFVGAMIDPYDDPCE